MYLDLHVCSLDLSQRLKELGVKRQSFLSYYQDINELWHLTFTSAFAHLGNLTRAYTVCELGKMLPDKLVMKAEGEDDLGTHFLECLKVKDLWALRYGNYLLIDKPDTEANVRARALIFLLELNLIDVETINLQ